MIYLENTEILLSSFFVAFNRCVRAQWIMIFIFLKFKLCQLNIFFELMKLGVVRFSMLSIYPSLCRVCNIYWKYFSKILKNSKIRKILTMIHMCTVEIQMVKQKRSQIKLCLLTIDVEKKTFTRKNDKRIYRRQKFEAVCSVISYVNNI